VDGQGRWAEVTAPGEPIRLGIGGLASTTSSRFIPKEIVVCQRINPGDPARSLLARQHAGGYYIRRVRLGGVIIGREHVIRIGLLEPGP
jgi:hypothetical protein